jgi:hypothetical protein
MAAADIKDTKATGPSAAKPEPIADLWDLIARTVIFEQIGLATWWIVAIESNSKETALAVAHLDADRALTCRLSEDGARIVGSNEPAFRRRVAGILGELQTGAR